MPRIVKVFAGLYSYSKEHINDTDYVIGVDKGAYELIENGVKVDLAVGDFDSINEESFNKIKETGVTYYRYYAIADDNKEKIYLSYLAQARDELKEEIEDKGFEQSRIKILALLTRLRQICCHPSLFISNYKEGSGKLNQCIELVRDAVQGGHKMLLFSGYTSMFELIEQALKKEGINYELVWKERNLENSILPC